MGNSLGHGTEGGNYEFKLTHVDFEVSLANQVEKAIGPFNIKIQYSSWRSSL
jgi:hypothetical protein